MCLKTLFLEFEGEFDGMNDIGHSGKYIFSTFYLTKREWREWEMGVEWDRLHRLDSGGVEFDYELGTGVDSYTLEQFISTTNEHTHKCTVK
jgi:hypothetical protein